MGVKCVGCVAVTCEHLWNLVQVQYIRDTHPIAVWHCVKCGETSTSKYSGEAVAPEKVLYVK